MNYDVFVSTVKREVERRMEKNITLKVCHAVKNNNTKKTGLAFLMDEQALSPTIYLEEYFELFESGEELGHVVERVITLFQEIQYGPSWSGEDISNYSAIKDLIACRLVNADKNADLLEEVPHQPYLDLAIVYYLLLEVSRHGTATMLIRREHLVMWEIDEELLAEQASLNMPRLLPVELKGIEMVISELAAEEQELLPPEYEQTEDKMYVLSNEIRSFGASAILYPGQLEAVAALLGEAYYVLPSSIHEVIIVPESGSMPTVQMEAMVTEINQTQVDEEEVLSNRVYYYDNKKEPQLKLVHHKSLI